MRIKNISNSPQVFIVGSAKIKFDPYESLNFTQDVGSHLLMEFKVLQKDEGSVTEQLIISEPMMQENQELISEIEKPRTRKKSKKKFIVEETSLNEDK